MENLKGVIGWTRTSSARKRSKKLGVSPDQLKSQLQQGNVQNAVQGGKVDMNRFQKIVKDPGKIQQMLDTPAAKQLLKQLSEEK